MDEIDEGLYEARLEKFKKAALEKRVAGELMYQRPLCSLEGIDEPVPDVIQWSKSKPS